MSFSLGNVLAFRSDNLKVHKELNMSDAEKDAAHLRTETAQAWDEYIEATAAVTAAKRAELVAWRRWRNLDDQLTVADAFLRAKGN